MNFSVPTCTGALRYSWSRSQLFHLNSQIIGIWAPASRAWASRHEGWTGIPLESPDRSQDQDRAARWPWFAVGGAGTAIVISATSDPPATGSLLARVVNPIGGRPGPLTLAGW